jgi:hypothetical protein
MGAGDSGREWNAKIVMLVGAGLKPALFAYFAIRVLYHVDAQSHGPCLLHEGGFEARLPADALSMDSGARARWVFQYIDCIIT